MQHVPRVLEKILPLAYKVSVLAARGADSGTATWPLAENVHCDGVLFSAIMPLHSASDDVATRTHAAAAVIAEEIGYAGVLCIGFFVLQDGSLTASEVAPRPHNSDHVTMDVCGASQLEQQMCTMVRLPLGNTRWHSSGHMLDVLGDAWFRHGLGRTPAWHEVMGHSGVKVHLYGEADTRLGRKIGHVNCVGISTEVVDEAFRHAAHVLGLQPG